MFLYHVLAKVVVSSKCIASALWVGLCPIVFVELCLQRTITKPDGFGLTAPRVFANPVSNDLGLGLAIPRERIFTARSSWISGGLSHQLWIKSYLFAPWGSSARKLSWGYV